MKAKLKCCLVCGSRAPVLVYCLDCIFTGCLSKGHFQAHAKEKGHRFGVEILKGELWCAECGDVVYSATAEERRREAENEMRGSLGLSLVHRWSPRAEEVALLRDGRLSLSGESSLGLRGLLNLGNTCFMSCILQAMSHTPLLRDYFLSDQHRCRGDTASCLMCEMAALFQELYGGERKPLIPFRMLHLVWTHARHLAGYEQQDAHEFFIATLELLHRHSRSAAAAAAGQPCRCIIDRIFTGRLQSDVACSRCGHNSRTLDPYWDISLDLGLEPATDLRSAIARFTRREDLGPEARCSACAVGGGGALTKQLSLRHLPIVACFHLKRFEHSSKLHKKIRSTVRFPEYLDLTEFTSAARDAAQPPALSAAAAALSSIDNKYALFAVVNHHGTMESGHYTCFVRQAADEWFKADDHVVSAAAKADVLASEGYLLFYHKHFLAYQ